MRRRRALHLGGAGLVGFLTAGAGCTALSGATTPVTFDNDTRSTVRFEVRTEVEDGSFSRDIGVVLPDNGGANDPWLKQAFVDEKIEASYHNGVLEVHVPVAEAMDEEGGHRIDID